MQIVDTIIIGGGIAGLYTAMQLQGANESLLLLEAKSEPGGRILSKPVTQERDLSVDLGPTWFWPHQTRMKSLVKRLELDWFEQYVSGDALYQHSPDFEASKTQGGHMIHSLRVKGGMQSIIQALLRRIDSGIIKTEHVANDVEFIDGVWRIKVKHNGTEKVFQSKNLIMAVPPRIIARYLMPEKYLSAPLVETLKAQQTWMAEQAKFVAVYETPFWRKQGLSGQAMSRVGPMVEMHDATSSDNEGAALFGFVGVPADSRKKLGNEELKSACLNQLIAIFGEQAATPEVTYLKDWSTDKFTATEQDIYESPRHANFKYTRFADELSQLNLYLVATEFAQEEPGYLEGALQAADAALTQINSQN